MDSRLAELSNFSRYKRVLTVGDLHGDYASLCSILKIADLKNDLIVFLGDYADRGEQGVEVIETLQKLARENPENTVLLKGNHESFSDEGEPAFFPFTLGSEVSDKGKQWKNYFGETLKPFFDRLFLAAIVPSKLLFVHGGVSSRINSLDDLKFAAKTVENDVLWSDPFEGTGERLNSARGGVGVEFGEDVTEKVCECLGVNRIIRSHEPRKAMNGPDYSHNNRVITISSTRVYGGHPFILSFEPPDMTEVDVIRLS